MKTEEIKELLVARGYSQKNAGLVALEIKTLEPSLIPLWEKWVANANSCENCEAIPASMLIVSTPSFVN